MPIKKRQDKTYFIEDDKPEFNMMAYYMMRMDNRSNERDLALNEGDLYGFYRSTMTLLMNSIPRFLQKKMPEDQITKLKEDLYSIGKKIKSMSSMSDRIQGQNKIKYEEHLFEFNIELNTKMFEFGLIYPVSKRKEIEDVIEEDF